MSHIALYTFGLLDPSAEPEKLADFRRRVGEIFGGIDRAAGFLGRATKLDDEPETFTPGDDYGQWGTYVFPNISEFAGHRAEAHIATFSLWRNLDQARSFVYHGLHRDALRIRYEWFLKGPWPSHVLWNVPDEGVPTWSDGVKKYQLLARDGESSDHITFNSMRSHA